jgi:nucleotide-binding universal stress UspA family protein
MLDNPHLLLCYDGSDQATEAIEFAGKLFPRGTRATVLYAWEPVAVAVSIGMAPVAAVPPEADKEDEARALRLAEDGAKHARSFGLDAEARIEPAIGSAWRTIVEVADGEYDVIVMGTRGLTGVSSLLLGSSSHHVAQHAVCPVLIVPSAQIGEARRGLARANGHGVS